MKRSLRAWTALGAALGAGATIGAPPPLSASPPTESNALPQHGFAAAETGLSRILVAQAEPESTGEGEGGALPSFYSLLSTDPHAFDFDAAPQIAAYVELMHRGYAEAAARAAAMQLAIEAFLADPTPETLAAARTAWIAARPAYMRTEVGRFYDGPIEAVESRINAWPLNEAFIDYVAGDPDAGLVNDLTEPITLATINGLDQAADEADVTTGWHAIEFLLWGQDRSATGPGDRPASDYAPGTPANQRRAEYLRLVTAQLVGDLQALAEQWGPGDGTYAATFKALPQREALGRIVNGLAILVGEEFMSQRLTVGLDSGDQEDEHSCFSDTTHQDFVADLAGVAAVWTGGGAARPGIGALVRSRDAALADRVDGLLADATAKVDALGDPWDAVLASPPDSPARQDAEAAVDALQALTDGLVDAGTALGVLVLVPNS